MIGAIRRELPLANANAKAHCPVGFKRPSYLTGYSFFRYIRLSPKQVLVTIGSLNIKGGMMKIDATKEGNGRCDVLKGRLDAVASSNSKGSLNWISRAIIIFF